MPPSFLGHHSPAPELVHRERETAKAQNSKLQNVSTGYPTVSAISPYTLKPLYSVSRPPNLETCPTPNR